MDELIRKMALESGLCDPDLCDDTQLITDYGDATEVIEKFVGMVLLAERQRCYRLIQMNQVRNGWHIHEGGRIGHFYMKMLEDIADSQSSPTQCDQCPHMGPYGHGEPPDCLHPLKGSVGTWEFANPRGEPPAWCPVKLDKIASGKPPIEI